MSESLAAQVDRLLWAQAAGAIDAAREEGYRRGYTEGRAEADGAWRARLQALAGVALAGVARGAPPAAQDASGEEEQDRRRAGAGALVDGEPPSPSPSDGGEPQVPPPPSPAAVPAAAPVAEEAPRGIVAWRTAERRARLVALYADPAWSLGAIWRELMAMPGPSMGHLQNANMGVWVKKLREEGVLGERPAGSPVRWGGPAPAAPADEDEGEDVPVDTLPPGEVRETPQLRRARELLGMGVRINDVKTSVKLTVVELDALKAGAV